jgi:hypothetical protein
MAKYHSKYLKYKNKYLELVGSGTPSYDFRAPQNQTPPIVITQRPERPERPERQETTYTSFFNSDPDPFKSLKQQSPTSIPTSTSQIHETPYTSFFKSHPDPFKQQRKTPTLIPTSTSQIHETPYTSFFKSHPDPDPFKQQRKTPTSTSQIHETPYTSFFNSHEVLNPFKSSEQQKIEIEEKNKQSEINEKQRLELNKLLQQRKTSDSSIQRLELNKLLQQRKTSDSSIQELEQRLSREMDPSVKQQLPNLSNLCSLRNNGNTCFLNSALQFLWKNNILREYLINLTDEQIDSFGRIECEKKIINGESIMVHPYNEYIPNLNTCTVDEFLFYKNLLKCLIRLFNIFYSYNLSGEKKPIDLSSIMFNRKSIYDYLVEYNEKKGQTKGEQGDPNEFLNIISDIFTCFNNDENILIYLQLIHNQKSILFDRDISRPLSTKNESSIKIDLKMSQTDKFRTLKEYINKFEGSEVIDYNSRQTNKKIEIIIGPFTEYIIITLNRLSHQGKILTKVEPDKFLKIKDTIFIIQGCILHIGQTSNSGHYIFINYDEFGNPLTIHDDATEPSPINPKIHNQNDGYIYLYKKYHIQ